MAASGLVGSCRCTYSCGCVGRWGNGSLNRTSSRCRLLVPGLWSSVLAGGSLLHQAFGVVLLGLLGPRRTAALQESPNQDREGGRTRSIQENGVKCKVIIREASHIDFAHKKRQLYVWGLGL